MASQYYKVTAYVGTPHRNAVEVTIPLVGPAGPQGPAGEAGAGAVESVNGQTGVVVLDAADVGAAATLHASQHEIGGSDVLELDSQQVLVDSVFLSTALSNLAGIYLRNGSDNGKPLYENAEYRTYFWWDSGQSKWFLTSGADVNLFESSSDTTFPWLAAGWAPIAPQTGTIDVDQAQLFDVSDQSIGNPSLLRTPKSGNATSTELVLGNDSRLTDARTPSSHAASHHTGGTDALTPFSIGAESRFVTTSLSVFSSQTLAAGRAQIYILNVFAASTITLPSTGAEIGDRLVIVGGSPVSATATLSSSGIVDALTLQNQQFSYVYGNVGGSVRWVKNLVDSHTHLASAITDLNSASAGGLWDNPLSITGAVVADGSLRLTNGDGHQVSLDYDSATDDRFITIPNASGTLARTEDFAAPPAIGNTTPAAISGTTGTFTTLTANTSLTLNGTGAAELVNAGAAAGPLHIYNTFTSATNHERGFLRWSSNVFQVGTEKGSAGGTARALVFQTDGVTRLTVGETGTFTYRAAATFNVNTVGSGNNTLQCDNSGVLGSGRVVIGAGGIHAQALIIDPRGFGACHINAVGTDNNIAVQTSGATRLTIGKNGGLTISDANNIAVGTTTGTKIGTATTQKIGFFNATPVVQQAAVADATDAASTQDRLNDLLARLRTLGLIAT